MASACTTERRGRVGRGGAREAEAMRGSKPFADSANAAQIHGHYSMTAVEHAWAACNLKPIAHSAYAAQIRDHRSMAVVEHATAMRNSKPFIDSAYTSQLHDLYSMAAIERFEVMRNSEPFVRSAYATQNLNLYPMTAEQQGIVDCAPGSTHLCLDEFMDDAGGAGVADPTAAARAKEGANHDCAAGSTTLRLSNVEEPDPQDEEEVRLSASCPVVANSMGMVQALLASETLVLCGIGPHSAAVEAYRRNLKAECLVFSSHSLFTRWLFVQERGDVRPFATLLVTYRQARPCVQGLIAARSSDTTGIRVDNRRPRLPPLSGRGVRPDGRVGLAVETVIVLVEDVTPAQRLQGWIDKNAAQLVGLNIQIQNITDNNGFETDDGF